MSSFSRQQQQQLASLSQRSNSQGTPEREVCVRLHPRLSQNPFVAPFSLCLATEYVTPAITSAWGCIQIVVGIASSAMLFQVL